jgi:predicted dehydrogenase
MEKLGIGMIGYGGIGRVHVMAYRAIPYHYGLPADVINVAGVATTRPETAKRAAREIGCEFWTDDYRQLLDRDDIDLVDCCVPNYKHREIVVAAAKAGKHIYCEKPLAMDAAEGQVMVRAAEEAGVKSQLGFNFRYFPAITRARQLIEEGFLGRVFSFRGRYYRSSYISYDKPLSWRLRKDISGGGALFDLGSHVLDLIYYLLGEYDEVLATLDTLIKQRPVAPGASERGPVDVDDIALMQVRMSDGALGSFEISRMGTGATNDLGIEIYGDKGAIRFSSDDPSWLQVYDTRDAGQPLGGMRGFRSLETVQHYEGQKAPDWTMTPSFVRAHAESQYHFLKAISEGLPPSPTLADGLHIQEVMDAAARSSAEGRWVTLSEVRDPTG